MEPSAINLTGVFDIVYSIPFLILQLTMVVLLMRWLAIKIPNETIVLMLAYLLSEVILIVSSYYLFEWTGNHFFERISLFQVVSFYWGFSLIRFVPTEV